MNGIMYLSILFLIFTLFGKLSVIVISMRELLRGSLLYTLANRLVRYSDMQLA